MKKLMLAVALGSVAAGVMAAEKVRTPKEMAAENRILAAKYAKSVATVRYYVKKNADGVEPKFDIPYLCPNCERTHWKDAGVSVDLGIPAEFAGYVIGPDEVLLQDVMIAPEFVDRIEVTCAGETVGAVEHAACPAENALVLKTTRPLTAAEPLAFTGGGEPADPRYFYLVRENGGTVASVSGSNIGKLVYHVEAGKDIYAGKPNTLVLDRDGNPVTVAYQLKISLGEEIFTPPTAWTREPAAARFERKRAFEAALKKAVLPAYIQLEAAAKEQSLSRVITFSLDGSDDGVGNDIDTVVVLLEDIAYLPVKLSAKETARLVKIEATLPDGTKTPLEFVGSYAESGAIAVRFPNGVPAGLEPLRIDRRPAREHFGERVRVAAALNVGGAIEVKSGELDIWAFTRGKGNVTLIDAEEGRVLSAAVSEKDAEQLGRRGMMISSRGVVALELENRKEDRSWKRTKGLQGQELVALVEKPVFDAENVPRSADDRKRAPWLGVEVQLAGPDLLREKKAHTYFASSYSARQAALVTAVAPGSPAEQLGLQEGDILLSAKYPGGRTCELVMAQEFAGEIPWNEVFDDPRFLELGGSGELTPWPNARGGINGVLADKFAVGAEIVVDWVSGGKRKTGTCTLALAPVNYSTAPRSRNKELGLTVCDMTDEVRRYFKFDAAAPGVVVAKVKGGGTADVAGLRPLELILEVNGEGVTSAKDFAEKTKGKTDLTLTVRRMAATRMVLIKR